MSWDPAQYAKFTDLRLRPALDLLGRIALDVPRTIVDLGCGSGNVTVRIAERWPEAAITGVDSSPEMLAVARERYPQLSWSQADLGVWAARGPVELIYSNAALHWLAGHERLFPSLLAQLAPGGVLAVQMPRNFAAPSHAICHELASTARWVGKLGSLVKPAPVAEPAVYYDLLRPHVRSLDLWETEYVQRLEGDRPVLEWIKGTWLRPFLDRLDAAESREFENDYAQRAARAYPRRFDGVTLLPFRRLFIVATV